MSQMRKWARFWGKLARIVEHLGALPFAEPKMAVLYGTFAGIILAVGVEIVLGILTNEKVSSWSLKETSGVLFIAASVMISLVAWSLQLFNDFLVEKGKNREPLEEKIVQFCSWRGRWFTWAASLLVLVLLVSAAWVLASVVTGQMQSTVSNTFGR